VQFCFHAMLLDCDKRNNLFPIIFYLDVLEYLSFVFLMQHTDHSLILYNSKKSTIPEIGYRSSSFLNQKYPTNEQIVVTNVTVLKL